MNIDRSNIEKIYNLWLEKMYLDTERENLDKRVKENQRKSIEWNNNFTRAIGVNQGEEIKINELVNNILIALRECYANGKCTCNEK